MEIQNKYILKSLKYTFICSLCALLLACSFSSSRDYDRAKDIIDPDFGMTREQFKDSLMPKKSPKDKKAQEKISEPSIPEISDILTSPTAPETIPDKLISLSVTEDVPLKDVLIELSRLADIDMEIDPGISGGIIFRVKDKPFNEVIERVVDLSSLRYSVKNGVMRIERDTPYQKSYKVDFLNMARNNESSINIDSQVLGGSDGGGDGLSSGSTNSITSNSENDIWASVGGAITSMLNLTQAAADPIAVTGETDTSDFLQINKPAGILSVIATKRQHKNISRYLSKVKEKISSQVLIEAKIVEVTLDEAYRSGIDWGTLRDQTLNVAVAGNFKGGVSTTADFFTIRGDSDKNLTTAISFTETFGVSRTLSSPRLHAMNNQQAVLTFAENNVYFTLDVQEETDGTGADQVTTLTVESTLNTVPIGVILTLQPSINVETQEVTMHIRPTLSRITKTVQDPGVDIIVARQTGANPISVTSDIPVIEVRELDSILKIKSGEIMVIGGLMKDIVKSDDVGVPYINRAPLIGNLFKSKVQTTEVVETIIFIKATIVPSQGVSKNDQNIYENFMQRDPHPLAF